MSISLQANTVDSLHQLIDVDYCAEACHTMVCVDNKAFTRIRSMWIHRHRVSRWNISSNDVVSCGKKPWYGTMVMRMKVSSHFHALRRASCEPTISCCWAKSRFGIDEGLSTELWNTLSEVKRRWSTRVWFQHHSNGEVPNDSHFVHQLFQIVDKIERTGKCSELIWGSTLEGSFT